MYIDDWMWLKKKLYIVSLKTYRDEIFDNFSATVKEKNTADGNDIGVYWSLSYIKLTDGLTSLAFVNVIIWKIE